MKYNIVLVLILLFPVLSYPIDKPDGFASISGNGLGTTTGGMGGKTITVTTLADLQLYAKAAEPYIILVKGKIDAVPEGLNINVASNKTIAGLGNDATIYQGELHLINVSNVIIRNLTIRDSYVEGDYDGKTEDWDGIQADSCHHIWIDHCFLTHNCDGLIDLRKACDYVTVSWVHFYNHNKTLGIGWTTDTGFHITVHHCYFDSTNQRNPSFDMGMGHLYNNYIRKMGSYGNYARGYSRVIIENSVFEDSKNPVIYDTTAKLYVSGLQITDCTGGQTANVTAPPYNIRNYYNYSLDETSKVKAIVKTGAGPDSSIGKQYLSSAANTEKRFSEEELLKVVSLSSFSLKVRINTEGPYTVSLLSLNGRAIQISNGRNTSTINFNINTRGVYFLSLHKNNGRFQQKCEKIIIQ